MTEPQQTNPVLPAPGRDFTVDAHHHLWDLRGHRHAWLDQDPALAPLRRTFDLDDYRTAVSGGIAGLPVGRTVLVQSLASAVETVDLLRLAEPDALVGAVVGWVDLEQPDVAEQLGRLRAGPGGYRLRAIRHLVQDEPDPDWLTRPSVLRGLRVVAAYGLGYDVLVRPHQLASAVTLAEQLPELPLVLDHAGKPDLSAQGRDRVGALASWAADLRPLAAHPQVTCKLSGLITEANWSNWSAGDLAPVLDVLLETFGPRRLMFGSDWPVCLLAGTWQLWAQTVQLLLAPLTATERADILGGNATRIYSGPGLAAPTSRNPSATLAGRR
jgi:predicted TIM-barrel fold metal-dependent hydrolase